ncbi:MAG: glycoside hydrolase family 57 protein [Burkholderiales bacterium]|nr:glycoside hydrolase family 57 protein [Burkholderiales bacterium]
MTRPLDLVLVWHMHQPDYRDRASGEFREPWVYLHALKDYSDMAWHLERHEGMRAVVNFTPVLLDQLEDYAGQFASGRLADPLLGLLARRAATPLTPAERAFAIDRCFRANHVNMIRPFAAYGRLHEIFEKVDGFGAEALDWLSDGYLYDLVTWYHLAWTGETVRRESALVARLMSQGCRFTEADRLALFALVGEVVRGIVPRWRALAADGRVELSTTPHYHPIAPLLIDLAAGRETEPRAPLPAAPAYPGGRERADWQLRSAIESHARRFGEVPEGLWPAEGALSAPFLRLIGSRGLAWTATGEGVLAASLRAFAGRGLDRARDLYRPWRLPKLAPELAVFFRDDRLSDLIGFEYQRWVGPDAAANFVAELRAIAAAAPEGERPVVSVILDGENPWEYYPYNGWYFLDALYERLASDPAIRPTTYREYLARRREAASDAPPPAAFGELAGLTAGSWVYGNLATWIGSADKNRAWDLLVAAKQSYDLVAGSGRLDEAARAAAAQALGDCEGSDWFWWFGDYNPAQAVASFDRLYRAKLAHLYRILGLPVPAALDVPVSRGAGHPEAGGTMRRSASA